MKKRLIIIICLIGVFAGLVALAVCTGKPPEPSETEGCTSYDIVANLDIENGILTASQRVLFVNNTKTAISELVFNLYPNAYREDAAIKPVTETHRPDAYYAGESFGSIEIAAVKDQSSALNFEIGGVDKNLLCVDLSAPVENGGKTVVEMEYAVKLPKTHTRFGITKTGVSLCNFYPILCVHENGGWYEAPYYPVGDPFYSETAVYTVDLTVPRGGTLAATGQLVESLSQNGRTTYRYAAEKVRDFAMVYLPEGKTISERVNGKDVNYFYTSDENPDFSLKAAADSLAVYEEAYGAYPYPVFNVVDTDFIYGGMEYPNLIIINNALDGFNREYTIAHETAHQWWYGMVGNNSIEEAWQDEGLTEFSTALYFKHTGREPLYNAVMASAYDTYVYAAARLNGLKLPFDGVMRRALNLFSSETAYIITAYDKGMLMFQSLYNMTGEKNFLKACRNYLNNNKYKNATPEDLMTCFPEHKKLIENWLNGKVILGAAPPYTEEARAA